MRHPLAHIPTASTRPSGRRTTRALVAVGVVVTGLVLAAPAVAHDALAASDPAADAVLTQAPTQVVLTFAAEQSGVGSEVLVTGGDGRTWSDGPAQVTGTTVTQPLANALPNGTYTVTWRSVAGDGHPVTGTFGFTVEAATPTPTPTATAATAPSPTVEPTESAVAPSPQDPADAVDVALPPAQTGTRPAWLWPGVIGASLAAAALVAWLVRHRRTTHE